MNYIRTKIAFFLLLLTLSSCYSNSEDLSGTWFGYRYNCHGDENLTQKVEIIANLNNVIATKLTGDDCITANEITWKGSVINGKIIGVVNEGIPHSEERRLVEMEIIIVNFDSLVMNIGEDKEVLTFGRIKK